MSKNRLTAWLRPALTLVALAGIFSLAGCGGGNGAPNNPYVAGAGPLAVLPATSIAYSGVPATINISGGTPPFNVASSDQVVLPIPFEVSGNAITFIPNNVASDTPVTLTVRDVGGTTAVATVTVKPALLVNSLTLKPDNFSADCPSSGVLSTNPTDTSGSTWICSGQTGSIAIHLQNTAGGGLSGKQVKFDIVQGDFQIFTNGPGQPETFALTYTVPTDQNGNAVARIRANPTAHQQIVIVQATDVASGTFVRGVFVIQQHGDITTTQLLIVPNTVTITGPSTIECSSGVTATFFIFGGQPPYTITNTLPTYLQVSPTVVNASGSGFNVTTLGGCVTPATLSVTDAAGHTTTFTINNTLGTIPPATTVTNNPIIVAPLPVPTLACGNNYGLTAFGGGTTTTQGNTHTVAPATTFLLSTNRPDILSITPSSVAPGAQITIQRLNSGTVGGPSVQLLVSDGRQSLPITVPVANTCP